MDWLCRACVGAAMVACLVAVDPATVTIHVHPGKAADADSVGTLAEALALAAQHAGAPRVEIVLAAGVHVLHRGLHVTTALPPLTIRGACEGVRVIGGLAPHDPAWQVPPESIVARLPTEAREHARVLRLDARDFAGWNVPLGGPVHSGHGVAVAMAPTEVFIGGVALHPARWPNQGLATIESVVDPGSVPRDGEGDMPPGTPARELDRGAVFVPKDPSRVSRWVHASDAWAWGYWNWDWSDEQLPIAAVDAERGTITLAQPHHYGVAQRGRFRVVNILEELDEPGECWIDAAAGIICAWLPAGAEDAGCEVSMLAEPMIEVQGTNGTRIQDVDFACTRGSAVVARDVRGLRVERCGFRNLGTTALDLSGRRVQVSACRFEDIGGTGVVLAGGDRSTLQPGDGIVKDCTFRRCGRLQRTYNPAIRLEGVGQSVVRNEIAELPHMAILFSGNEHRIESNDIHHVVQETGDAGAVYTGRDWTAQGTVIRGNLFSDIRGSDARFQNAVYLDDMASGITVQGNAFIRCNWGMLVGGGRDDVVRGNVFAACGKAISYDARGVGWMARNIADPQHSTLHRTFAAVPVESDAWKRRYPRLGEYLSDRFGRPVRGEVVDNVLVGTPLGSIEDRKGVEERGNRVERVAGEPLSAHCDAWLAQVRSGATDVAGIAIGPVGPARP
jgi:hypothetical protein